MQGILCPRPSTGMAVTLVALLCLAGSSVLASGGETGTAQEAPRATVQVLEGKLQGQRVESRAGGHYWSFQGVPYARPPLGPLRFKDAAPVVGWEGVRPALQEGANCVQYDAGSRTVRGSEDCLYLNVYTPELPSSGVDDLLPVMVFLHGGGFEFGSGDAHFYGPDYLLPEGVVVVTVNYRLGVLGFLYLEEASPGNAGLKDQVAALRWVQTNIAAFGGDPQKVTLFGISAGGASVHFHMLSPMSKDLFHRAIAMSGAALNPWAIQTEPAETSRRLARLLGSSSENPAEIVDFLRGVDSKELARVAHSDAVPEKDQKRLLKFAFVPTPEKAVPGVQTFLPAPTEQLMKEGRHHAVPFMTGVAKNEALILLPYADVRKEAVQRAVDAQWVDNVLSETRLPPGGPKNKEALDALRQFFMGGQALNNETLPGYMNMFSDLLFHEGIAYALRCMTKPAKAPLYQYHFSFDRAGHEDDLAYLFRSQGAAPFPEDSAAATVRRAMVRMWTNFAKSGNPTPESDPLLGVQWKPYTDEERNFLEIGSKLHSDTGLYADRVAFWKNFYNTYGSK